MGRADIATAPATTSFAQIRTRFAQDDSAGAAVVAMAGTARCEEGQVNPGRLLVTYPIRCGAGMRGYALAWRVTTGIPQEWFGRNSRFVTGFKTSRGCCFARLRACVGPRKSGLWRPFRRWSSRVTTPSRAAGCLLESPSILRVAAFTGIASHKRLRAAQRATCS
jgi:hypothetical protein